MGGPWKKGVPRILLVTPMFRLTLVMSSSRCLFCVRSAVNMPTLSTGDRVRVVSSSDASVELLRRVGVSSLSAWVAGGAVGVGRTVSMDRAVGLRAMVFVYPRLGLRKVVRRRGRGRVDGAAVGRLRRGAARDGG